MKAIRSSRTSPVLPAAGAGLLAVGAAVVLDLAALRMLLAVASCLLLPGWGWARRFGGRGRSLDGGDRLALTIVLSICATVVVATTMVLTARWSMAGGLTALALITVAGFVPEGRLLAALHLARPRRSATAEVGPAAGWTDWYRRHEAQATAEQRQAETEWVDWYVGARRRAAADRARTRALQREADEQWARWFRDAHPERAARNDRTRSDQASSSRTTSAS